MFSNLIFDLDGTLIDSLPGIENSLRAALSQHHPTLTLPPDTLRPLVGPPLAQIIATLYPTLTSAETTTLVTAYRAHYLTENCAITPAFDGVAAALQHLHASGHRRLFILTNKPAAQTRLILHHLNWQQYFAEISCPDDPTHPFPTKPDGALALRRRHDLNPSTTLLVGDAPDDARAAAHAGFAFVGAAYGYGNLPHSPSRILPHGTRHGISSGESMSSIGAFADLLPLIDSQPPAADSHDHPEPLR